MNPTADPVIEAQALRVSAGAQALLRDVHQVTILPGNPAVAAGCRLLVLAIKPQLAAEVVPELAGTVTAEHLVVSILAGTVTATLERLLGGAQAGRGVGEPEPVGRDGRQGDRPIP